MSIGTGSARHRRDRATVEAGSRVGIGHVNEQGSAWDVRPDLGDYAIGGFDTPVSIQDQRGQVLAPVHHRVGAPDVPLKQLVPVQAPAVPPPPRSVDGNVEPAPPEGRDPQV